MWRAPVALCIIGLVAGCGGGGPSRVDSGAPTQFRADGVSAEIPHGWHATARPLTGVSSPIQRLVVASYPWHQRGVDGGCAPKTALEQMPAAGALLYMFEYQGPTHHDAAETPARPARFALDPASLQSYECMGRSYMVRFRDHGRVFQAHLYLGRHAADRTRRRLLGVLDSLRVRHATPSSEAVWEPPRAVLARGPYMGVSCHRPNRFACDRVGLAVWLRHPAVAVRATIDGRAVRLDDPQWSGQARDGRRRMFAGFLQPAGLLHGPLAIHVKGQYWSGEPPVKAGVGLLIERTPRHYVRTSLAVQLSPGWG